jgi:hypothetical protein
MTRISLLLAAVCLGAGPACAGPPNVERKIGKEPIYQTKAPQYGLLAFGPEGADRVWMVLDGDVLYVDRNGDGNLTEAGKKIMAEKKPDWAPADEGYAFQVDDLHVGGRAHKALRVEFIPFKRYAGTSLGKRADVQHVLEKDPNALSVSVRVDAEMPGLTGEGLGGRVVFTAGPADLNGPLVFAKTPDQAPVVRCAGPLEITFYEELPSLRVGRDTEMGLVVGAPGIGPGTFASLDYEKTIPRSAKPVVELVLQSSKEGVPPIKETFEIKGRC